MNKDRTLEISDFTVRVNLINRGKLLATADVIILNTLVIHGFRLSKSKYEDERLKEDVWIQPPCYKNFENYKKIFYLENRELWAKLKELIFSEYASEQLKKEKKINQLSK